VVIDEWNDAPDVLGAVKRAVDRGAVPGSYVLTGSLSGEAYPGRWQATGRVLDVQMQTMAAREIVGLAEGELFIDRALRPAAQWLGESGGMGPGRIDLSDYLNLVALGGYPDAVAPFAPDAAGVWLRNYARQLAEIDASRLGGQVSAARFGRYLRALALSSGQTPTWEKLAETSDIDRQTAAHYGKLVERLFVGWSAEPFLSNRLKRLARTPKRFIADTGLMLALAGVGPQELVRSPELLGQALETFVANQLRAEVGAAHTPPQLSHLREHAGEHEVDLVLEYPAGQVVGIEVKASAAPGPRAHRHLSWLRDQLGDRFAAGFVFHTGLAAKEVDTRIYSLPVAAIWSWNPADSGAKLAHFEQDGVSAWGRPTRDGGLQVFAGAIGLERLTPKAAGEPARTRRIERERADLRALGVTRPGSDPSAFVFTRNWVFRTPGEAAELLFGGQPSGPGFGQTAARPG
jgi:predicted AAA+ superfamily ATPase